MSQLFLGGLTVTEEDFETTEGESEDFYDKHMEMTG